MSIRHFKKHQVDKIIRVNHTECGSVTKTEGEILCPQVHNTLADPAVTCDSCNSKHTQEVTMVRHLRNITRPTCRGSASVQHALQKHATLFTPCSFFFFYLHWTIKERGALMCHSRCDTVNKWASFLNCPCRCLLSVSECPCLQSKHVSSGFFTDFPVFRALSALKECRPQITHTHISSPAVIRMSLSVKYVTPGPF